MSCQSSGCIAFILQLMFAPIPAGVHAGDRQPRRNASYHSRLVEDSFAWPVHDDFDFLPLSELAVVASRLFQLFELHKLFGCGRLIQFNPEDLSLRRSAMRDAKHLAADVLASAGSRF